jgi:serine/threonine-protein kinase RsbW
MIYSNGEEESLMNEIQQADVVRLELPAADKYLNVVSSCLEAVLERFAGVLEQKMVTHNAVLAVHETCTNIIEHAYGDTPGRIEVAISICDSPRRIVVDTHDTGRAFNVAELKDPDLNQAQTGGYGWYIIRNMVDEVTYAPQSGNNHWRLVKNL